MEIKKYLINDSVEWKNREYALFFGIIPLVLFLFFGLPENLQNQIILKPLEPTIISAFFSNYLHTNIEHLAGNLSFYLIVMLLLFNLETDKKRFYVTALGLFVILPLISSASIILVLSRINSSLGFSGIVSGFLGYMVYTLYAKVKQNYYSQLTYKFLWLLLMLNVFVWSISWPNYNSLIISSVMTVLLLYANWKAIKETWLKININVKSSVKGFLPRIGFISLTLAFAVFGMLILLPRDIVNQGNMINILAHYIGYQCGWILPVIYDNITRSKE
jgi:hypothetical protein